MTTSERRRSHVLSEIRVIAGLPELVEEAPQQRHGQLRVLELRDVTAVLEYDAARGGQCLGRMVISGGSVDDRAAGQVHDGPVIAPT